MRRHRWAEPERLGKRSSVGQDAPGHLLAHVEAVERLGEAGGFGRRLADAVDAAGPVVQAEHGLSLVPNTAPESAVLLERVEAALSTCNDARARAALERIKIEGDALRNREAQAQAKLQAAIASLKPTHDY